MDLTAQNELAMVRRQAGAGRVRDERTPSYWWRPHCVGYPYDRIGIPSISSSSPSEGIETMIDLEHPEILKLFAQHRATGRTDSAAFLVWYLENYYRLETVEAIDAVCDQPGDKGVDGIFVNDNNQTITIFQSRIYQRADATVGDAPLRSFAGTLTQFDFATKIEALIAAAGTAQVARLARKLDLVNKIATHELRGEFITNLNIDANGAAFVDATPLITFVGKTALQTSYICMPETYHHMRVDPLISLDFNQRSTTLTPMPRLSSLRLRRRNLSVWRVFPINLCSLSMFVVLGEDASQQRHRFQHQRPRLA